MFTPIFIDQSLVTLETLFSAMPVAMALVDRDGRYVALNQALATIRSPKVHATEGSLVTELDAQCAQNTMNDFARFDAGLEVPEHEIHIDERTFHVAVKALRNSDGFAIGLMVALTDISARKDMERQLAEANKRLEAYVSQDYLTGLWNRRCFEQFIDREIRRANREGTPLSLLLLDVDHFKGYNDCYGHMAGDECLKSIADAVQGQLGRAGDAACRYGGEEFAVIVPGIGLHRAAVLAERLRAAVEAIGLRHEGNDCGQVTISLGVAGMEPGELNLGVARDILVERADKALYQAKNSGRNRVRVWQREGYHAQPSEAGLA